MSALWSAQVVAKDNRRVVIELRAIHPDSGAFPTDKKFALRLIYDEAYGFAPGLIRESRGPLGDAIQLEQTHDDAFLDANVDRYIAHVQLGNLRNAPLDVEALRDDIDRQLTARGVRREDKPVWRDAWSEQWDAFWSDPNRLPTATYEIDVTDPRWIAHLERGSAWESAAF